MIDRSLYTDEELERIDRRECVCGCGALIVARNAKTLFVDRSHSQRRYRRKLKAEATAAGLPANLSLRAVHAPNPTTDRSGDAPNRRRAAQKRSPRPGLSVYFKSVDVAALAERLIAESIEAREMLGREFDDAPLAAVRAALERRRQRAA